MDRYVKSVIFTVILVVSAWEIMCIAPQGTTIIHKKPDSSSFIQQESGQNIPHSGPAAPAPNRDFVNPNRPQQNTQTVPGGQNLPQTPVPNKGGSRDYVNTNRPQQNTQNLPQTGPATSGGPQTSSNNRGGSRDYVNPNRPQQNSQNLPQTGPATSGGPQTSSNNRGGPATSGGPQTSSNNRGGPATSGGPQTSSNNRGGPATSGGPQTSSNNRGGPATSGGPQTSSNNRGGPATSGGPQTSSNNRGGSRDYVNPNAHALPQSGGAVRDYANPTIPQTSLQKGQQFRPSPRNTNLGGRGYVNPNFNLQTSYANIAGGPNTLQGANFPALPTRNGPKSPTVQSTTPLSYASKVSGGSTTKAPIGQQNPSVSGPTSSSTQRPEEGPSDTELRDFSEALLRRDVNNAAKFLTVNVQGKTTSQSKNDQAPAKLLVVQEDGYKISTISKLKLLHNNYILNTNENEYVTPQEKQEENDLLDSMLTTPVMQYTRNFLLSRGKITQDPKDFKNLLKLLWFNMYSRGGGRIGSSGFEHIFVAELKNNEVSGLHNWVYFDQAEMSNIADYLGYMKKIDLGEKGAILKFHFKLNGVDKPVGSMFIGTSPELEMALYTTCYMFRADRICPLRLNGNNFIIRTYNYRYRGKNLIGSAFPEI